jgi:hypothetical protein
MAAVSSHGTTTIPSASGEPAAPTGPRLSLDPALPQGGGVSGGWWPRSRDAGAGLPGMLTELTARAGRVSRVALQVDAFGSIPHQLTVGGHRVHVAWFRSMNANIIGLTMAGRGGLTLLVVPPQASPASAAEALRLAAAGGHTGRPAEILTAAGIASGDPGRLRAATSMAG